MASIAPLIEAFLDETLARQRAVSQHTRNSYAVSFHLSSFRREKTEGLAVGSDAGATRRRPHQLFLEHLEHAEKTRR